MTAYFIFEFRSLVEATSIRERVTEIWMRPGYGWEVDVYAHKQHGTLICDVLYYFFPDQEDQSRIEQILAYLFSIALDGRVYYYRFSEAMDMYWSAKQKLDLAQIFGEYCPNLGGLCLRYELIRP